MAFNWNSLVSAGLGALQNISGEHGTSFQVGADGTITGTQDYGNWWNKTFGRDTTDQQQWITEYNQAVKQYNQQYQLQQDSFNFNKDLANRQQDLAEESYYNGVKNQASQLASMGINPASQGQSLSGGTMQGGSGVGSVGSPQGVGRTTQMMNRQAMKMQMMSMLAGLAQKSKELSIAQQNADTNEANGASQRGLTDEQARDLKKANDLFEAFGVSPSFVKTVNGMDWKSLASCGILSLIGNANSSDKFADLSDSEKAEKKQEMTTFVNNVQTYDSLASDQKSVLDKFFEDHPELQNERKSFPHSTLAEWKREPEKYTDDRIYEILSNYYGV